MMIIEVLPIIGSRSGVSLELLLKNNNSENIDQTIQVEFYMIPALQDNVLAGNGLFEVYYGIY